jgi:hypothetical protein
MAATDDERAGEQNNQKNQSKIKNKMMQIFTAHMT